ncbi:hypothetical protein AB0M95_30280 [Sphaerisporangium sp. NPDC051017]|uniref:hypothetical protein n=1 Tax=Sphaerisporangium sp. NPDC051017 TaxID=3154636 RepID=UPI003426F03C
MSAGMDNPLDSVQELTFGRVLYQVHYLSRKCAKRMNRSSGGLLAFVDSRNGWTCLTGHRPPVGLQAGLRVRTPPSQETTMALRFYGKGGSHNDSCPSVHSDDADGSLVIVGSHVTDPQVLAKIQEVSHIDPHEVAIRVPKELKKILWEACGGYDPSFG